MPMTVKVDTGALSKLIQSRGLQPGGRVQQVLTNEIYKQAEPYTPMRSKTLIRTAQVGKDHITYVQPYSRYVYFGKVMVGRPPKKVTNKITEFSDNTAYINILPEDTESLRFGKYVYDVQLTFNGAVKTIIKPSTFTIGEEVTYDNGN